MNREEDITLIEIKPSLDKINSFLDLDENVLSPNKEQMYYKLPVYILQYPAGQESKVSFGIIKQIKEQEIFHNCWTSAGSAGGPILSMKSFKVIGLHLAAVMNKAYKIGKILNKAIIDIQNQFRKSLI